MIQKFPEFDFSNSEMKDFSGFEVMLILDANDLKLINIKSDINIPFIFIDHHTTSNEEWKNNLSLYNIIKEEYASTAEIIYELYEYYDVKLPKVITWLLISGLLVDSGVFRHGNNDTIKTASKMLNDGVELQDIFPMLRRDVDLSEKMAKIKGLQRVEIIQAGEFLIGVSHVSAYEATVASSLLNVGFDVTIVIAQKKKEFRISTRTRKDLCLKTGLHLGKILDEVAKIHEVTGGGHDGAAGITGQEDHELIMEQIIDQVKQILKKE
jgi:nanoRNase/pAp phosphatase (c-di-AMP/oligoRNAs hydrolase)